MTLDCNPLQDKWVREWMDGYIIIKPCVMWCIINDHKHWTVHRHTSISALICIINQTLGIKSRIYCTSAYIHQKALSRCRINTRYSSSISDYFTLWAIWFKLCGNYSNTTNLLGAFKIYLYQWSTFNIEIDRNIKAHSGQKCISVYTYTAFISYQRIWSVRMCCGVLVVRD